MSFAVSIPAVTYAIGDVHGRFDLLKSLLGLILEHRRAVQGAAKIVFLGDYIDRGTQSKDVVEFLRSGKLNVDFEEVVILKGNHEWILFQILRNGMDSRSWLYRNGGVEMLGSYGLTPEEMRKFPEDDLKFLTELPLYHSDGIRLFTHAGIPQGMLIDDIPEKELLRYRGEVRDMVSRLVVHGHNYVLREPFVTEHAINIDTYAFATNQLTCAVFEGHSRKGLFISTPGNEEKIVEIEQNGH